MKKRLLTIVFITLSFVSFSQVEVLSEKQLTIDIEDNVTIKPYKNNGFILVQKAFNEESAKINIWRFTLYNYDLSPVWVKEVRLDRGYLYNRMDFYEGNIYLVFNFNSSGQSYTSEFAISAINADGGVNTKEFELKKTPYRSGFVFIDGAYFFNTTATKSFKSYENLCKIDVSTMTLTQKAMDVPEKTTVIRSFSSGNTIYYRVTSSNYSMGLSSKKPEYDYLYTVIDNEIVEKMPIKLGEETFFDNLSMISSDSAHQYFLGITKKWIKGNRGDDENYDYNLFINNVSPNELGPFKSLEKKYLYELASKREIKLKNGGFGSEKKLSDNNYIISNVLRYKNKNLVVFDKYQSKLEVQSQNKYTITYLFTNSLIWCFDDEGEIEWTKNIEYNIISDNLEPKTKLFPYKNALGFIGEFDKEVTLITLSPDGDVVDGSEKYKTLDVLDLDEDLILKNSITALDNNKYLVWQRENVTYEQAKLKKKKKIYTIGLNLKVIGVK
jgi:hypothetical protein